MTLSADAILFELNAIKEYIHAVELLLASGRMPEMIGLDQRIGELCQFIQQAPPEIQKKCLPELKSLLENIESCGRNMKAFYSSYLDKESTPP